MSCRSSRDFQELCLLKPNAQTYEIAVIDALMPVLRIATNKFVKIKALAVSKLTKWVQSFVSDNYFGETSLIRDNLKSVATGGIAPENFVVARKSCFNTFEGQRTICSYFDVSLKNSSFRLPCQCHSSSTDCARELFKGWNGLASLIDCTRKNFLVGGLQLFCEWHHKWSSFGVILVYVAWPNL